MQTDEDFNIKFVSIVKKHRCLYDKKVPEYRNKDFQEKSWLDIAQETMESVPHCKERWRNLRACLSRYIKQQNSSDPQHKPYYLSEHMQFLLPFLKSNRQSSGSTYSYDMRGDLSMDIKHSEHGDTTDGYTIANQKYLVTPKHRLSETDTASVNCVPDVHVEIDHSDNEPEVVFMTANDRVASDRKRMKMEHNNYLENADIDFFRSILPDIQGMTALQKRKFKIGILELIDDVLVKYPDKKQGNGFNEIPNGYLRKS